MPKHSVEPPLILRSRKYSFKGGGGEGVLQHSSESHLLALRICTICASLELVANTG